MMTLHNRSAGLSQSIKSIFFSCDLHEQVYMKRPKNEKERFVPSCNIRPFSPAYNQPMLKLLRLGWMTTWILSALLAGCLSQVPQTSVTLFSPTLTATHTPVPPTLTATPTPTFTPIPSQTPTPEPAGCQKPPEDYTRVE